MKLCLATVITTILVSGWWLAFTLENYPEFCGTVGFLDFIGSILWIGFIINNIITDWNKV
jgi:hypothetical protein